MKTILTILTFLLYASSTAQTAKSNSPAILPFNRLIQSAGKVITYGDSSLENHTLDLCALPDKKMMVIEDRYGIALINSKEQKISYRWTYANTPSFKSLTSTYSGISSIVYKNKTWIFWGAAGGGQSGIMIAEYTDGTIGNVSMIKLEKTAPATIALPNQVLPNIENGNLFLYAALNGNNQLVKIGFDDQKTIWSVATGAAPYGICIVRNKAFVTNWAGPQPTDSTKETAGIPWGKVYTNPVTGATLKGSLSVIDINSGALQSELLLGLHPNAIISSPDQKFLYITNSNSDFISVIDITKTALIDSVAVGLFSKQTAYYGSSPNGLCIDPSGNTLYVTNGLDNAVAVVHLGKNVSSKGTGITKVDGYIPTEAYPSGVSLLQNKLYVTNLEAKGAAVLSEAKDIKQQNGESANAYSIHKQLASLSIISLPDQKALLAYTQKVKELNLVSRMVLANQPPRKNISPKPVPDRIGEPSVFKHVIYIIKENKTYDQVYGDIATGNGDKRLCIYGDSVTPNQHKLTQDFILLDNYFASGKSSAEGHQWTDAAIVSDYVEKNVRSWFRSYPHRQTDALVYNKSGFIWNQALDHGKSVRIYGEACTTHFDNKLKWLDIFHKQADYESIGLHNTSTIARIRPIISPDYPDCDNFIFTDQLRANIFIKEWKAFEQMQGDQLPNLIVLSLPNDHTSGTSPNFPVPKAMVADNDLALGRIIETITKSRFWDSTVVFVTEDDSQSGWDHVSSYRTTGLVISPYTLRNKTVSTNYNQTSMVRTIEQILGIPPMNIIDATAQPMFDCFSNNKSSFFQYTYIPNKIPLDLMNKSLAQLKGKASYYAKLSQNVVFKDLDGGDDDEMNRILWFDAKGEEPYPKFIQKNKQ